MSSFGAASTGVDPQTGSYLSAEQRVAMFKGATGRSGFRGRSGGGGTGGGGGGNPAVQPQNAIVVANKMTSVVQKLQTSYQQTTNTVASQVSQNRQTIENLSKVIAANREQELAEEKAETRLLRGDKEAKLRADRESLIEGLAAGAAGIASSVSRATQAVTKPLGGLLQRLLLALGSLAAAWAIDNFDTILGWAEDLKDRLDALAGNFDKDLGDIRGVWSIFDLGLKRVMPFIRNLAARVGRIGRRIFDSAVDIGKKIFTKLKDFFTEIGRRIVRRLGDLWKAATGRVANVFRRPPKPTVPDSGAPKLPPGTDPDLDTGGRGPNAPDPTDVKPKGNWFTRRLDDIKGGLSRIGSGAKSMFDSGMEGLSKMKGSLQSALSSLGGGNADTAKPLGGAQKGFLSRILEGVARKAQLPKNLLNMLKSGMKNVDALFKRIPFVGFAIDAFLNHQAGVEFQENMIRSLSSAISGMVGAGAGAKIGGGIGFAAGSVVPVLGNAAGAAIGAALGAIIGGMLAGTAGDAVGAVAYESFTGKEATDTGALGSRTAIQGVRDIRDTIMGESGDTSEPPKVTIPAAAAFESGSTPEGLYNPDIKSAFSMDFSEIELPAIDLRSKNFSPQSAEGADSMIEQIPDIMSFNPETSFYRDYSVLQYNLAG